MAPVLGHILGTENVEEEKIGEIHVANGHALAHPRRLAQTIVVPVTNARRTNGAVARRDGNEKRRRRRSVCLFRSFITVS
jgi:hypothetical protein